jgi:hypothetical protein
MLRGALHAHGRKRASARHFRPATVGRLVGLAIFGPLRTLFKRESALEGCTGSRFLEFPVVFQKEACDYSCWKPKGGIPVKEKQVREKLETRAGEQTAGLIACFFNAKAEDLL